MSVQKFIPLDFKQLNKIYGFKQYNPIIEDNEYLLDKIYKSAKQNREQISEQSLMNLNKNRIQPPTLQTPIKYKQQVETIINDIHDKEFLSWMLSKKQMRKMNQQNRLGNSLYSSRLIKQIESNEEAQTIRKQSSLCVEDLAQILSSSQSTSNNIPEQKTKIQQFFPSKFYTQSTQSDDNNTFQQSTQINNINKLSCFREYPEQKNNNQNQKQRVQSFQRESQNEQYECKKQPSKSIQQQSHSQNQMKLLTQKIHHIRTESLPTTLSKIQNSVQTNKQLNIRINTHEARKTNPIPIENLLVNKSLDIKQVYSNDTTRNDSNSKQYPTMRNTVTKQTSKEFFTDRAKPQQDSTKSLFKMKSKIMSSEDEELIKFTKQNKNDFSIFQKLKKIQPWKKNNPIVIKSKMTEELESLRNKKQEQKYKIDSQLKAAQEKFNLEEYPVISSQMKISNKNIMNSPLFQFLQNEPYKNTFLLYDYIEDKDKFKVKQNDEDEEENNQKNRRKNEAYKRFKNYVIKHNIQSELL